MVPMPSYSVLDAPEAKRDFAFKVYHFLIAYEIEEDRKKERGRHTDVC